MQGSRHIIVWDPLVRIVHWALLAAFSIAYLTQGDPLRVHLWAGYAVAGLVILRVVWGFVGSRHARFRDFLYSPVTVVRYLGELVRLRSPRYLGHSPAGGAMAVALLLLLALTTGTGLLHYGAAKHAGPLAFLFPAPAVESPSDALPLFPSLDDPVSSAAQGPTRRGSPALKELHEFLANVTLLLVVLHVAGVVLASVAHRENLAGAMLTGRKRAE